MPNLDLERALADMAAARRDLLALVSGASADDLAHARPGGWTLGRVLHHIIESEAIYAKLLAHQCGRAAPEIDARPPADGADAVARLAATRAAVEALADGIDNETLYRLGRFGHEEYSPLSVLENVASHDRDHQAQIAELMPIAEVPIAEAAPHVAQTPGDVSIRPATIADLPRLTEIYNHYIAYTAITFDIDPVTVDERRPWFAQFSETGPHRLLVAGDAGVIAGYAGCHQFRTKKAYNTTVETTIYCAPEATGRGIGPTLYAALFDALLGEDVRMAVAGITVPNDASCALHERFGFRRVGVLREVGRKFGRYWDVAWYERRMG